MSTSGTETDPGTAPHARRRLERARSGRMIAGVAEGLGRYFAIDPVVFRIAFVVTTVAGGAGIVAYIAAVLVMPEEGSRRAPIHLGRYTTWVPWALVGIGFLAFADGFDHGGLPFAWGLFALALAAWFVWSHDRERAPGTREEAPPPAASVPGAAPPAEHVAPAPYEPRRPSVLGRLTLSLLLVGAGTGLAIAQASDDVTGLDVEAWLGGGLLVVGLALVVGAWWGRARALIAMGVLLTIGAATASLLDVPLRGGIGDRRWAPVAASEVRPAYRLGIGDAVLDLTAVDAERITTDVTLSVGHVRVIVPRDATVDVDAHTGLGELIVFGRESDGSDLDESFRSRGSELGPTIDLDVRLGVGQLEVIRDPS